MTPFAAFAFALRRTWDEWISTVMISAIWLLAQVLIIPGPPMTAALFAMARHTYDADYWNAGNVWYAFKEMFVPAWKWALPNIAVIGLSLYNISTFWNLPGLIWYVLRVVWFLGLMAWLGLNMFYWPFWLEAVDRTMRNTYANSIRFWLLHPATALVLFLICLAVGLICLPFALPIVLGVVFWMAMVAETAVRRSLEQQSAL